MPKTAADFLKNSTSRTGISFLSDSQRNSLAERQSAEQQAAQKEEQNQGGLLGGIGYSLEKIGLGFLSGIEGIWDYTAGGLAKLFGADDWAEQQIANDWVNYNHADEWFNPSEGWQFVGDVAGGIGTSLPSMAGVAAAGAITVASGGTLSPVAATLIAGSIAGLGAAGRATKEAYDQTGELGGKEFGYGALSGITEGAIEGVSSALGAGTGAVIKSISKSFGKEVAKSATRNTLLKGVVKGFAGEAFEEGVQAILEPVYKRMTYDPNAKNATFQEVAYAALVGGLSGAIMGGGDVAVRNIRGTTRGNTLVNEGKAGDVITTAEQISSYQTENQTDYETFQVVQNTLDELKTSLQKTDGEVRTVRQKMLLGVLEQANTSAAFEPIVTASAENIYNNAETVAARLNELGYQDQNGKPIQVTAEQIREGIDTTDAKKFRQTMSKALKNNSVLRTLAVADTVGQITMDTARFRDATLAGQHLSTQADLNRFTEQATDAERQAVAERLGIESWETLTNEQFQDKITEFVANGGVQEYQQARQFAQTAESLAPESARKHIPRMVNLRNDGAYRYTQGDADIAVIKNGEDYYIYDYADKLISKKFNRTEVNRHLREIIDGEQRHSAEQNRLREQAAELDGYARENIEGYKNLSAAGQAAIRATIRQGRAAGISEADLLMYARVSAHSGISVMFNKEECFLGLDNNGNPVYSDGFYDIGRSRIVVNPEGNRSAEKLLLHELTHAVYNRSNGVLTEAEGVRSLTTEERNAITEPYKKIGITNETVLKDELNAHYAERTLTNKNVLERLARKKSSLKEKILGFFSEARTEYKSDSKLTGAANRLYRQYKKLFDEFSERNQRYLGVENPSKNAVEQAATLEMQKAKRLAIKRDVDGNEYVEVESRITDSNEPAQIAGTLAQIVRDKFSSLIDVHGQNIGVNQRTAREWLRSKSAEKLLKTDNQAFLDKVNAFENADELLKASRDYIGEAVKHKRKDSFVEFARGTVAFKVGENGYEADVIVGTTKTGAAVLYDLVNIQHKKIVADTTDTARNRRSGVSATTNNIHQNEESVNRSQEKSSKSDAKKRYALSKEDEQLLFDEQFYEQFANEDRSPIKETIEELEKIKKSDEFDSMSFEDAYAINTKLRALRAGYDTLYDYFVGEEKARLINDYEYSARTGNYSRAMQLLNEKQAARQKSERLKADIAESTPHKNAQFQIIQDTNPMFNDTSLGIRSPKDIKTFAEVVDDPESFVWGDFSREDARKALKRGTVRVYSSYPIKNGVFVSTSYQQALDYAGGEPSGVHSRVVALDSVAWINGDEGQYAKAYQRTQRESQTRFALPELEQEAVKHFGHTYSWAETGYVLTDGSRLDFSGRRDGSGGGARYEDHRDIAQLDAYSGFAGTDAMIDFMKRGNIRIMPEGDGINLSVRPTRAQENTLADFISRRRGEVTLDIDNERGETVVSVEYPRGTHSNKILQDIRNYFESGVEPTVSEVQRFRYALPETDSTGETLSAEQREFFKDSKVVDENGRLLKVYHGTPRGDFTIFNAEYGAYFSANEAYARRYTQAHNSTSARVIEAYLNITKPFDTRHEAERKIFENEFYRKWGNGAPLSDSGLPDWTDGDDLIAFINENGYDYDGLILDEGADGGYGEEVKRRGVSYVALSPEQIKLTSNKRPTNDSDIRFALSDSALNVDTEAETAAWTTERMTDLIERYGARNPRYAQAYAVWVNPEDFVNATTTSRARRDQIFDEAGNLDIDALARESQTPFLSVDYETMRIVGHEGRHRMAALAKAGVKRVAVAIRFTEDSLSRYDARIMEGEHTFKGQSFSSWNVEKQRTTTRTSRHSIKVGTLIPINAAYAAQLSEFTGGEHGVRYAIDSSNNGTDSKRTFSVGQRAQFAANNTGMRVYTKAEAADVINSIIEERLVFDQIGMYGELRGKDKQAAINYLFEKLNSVKEGYRSGIALRIADYMIEHTVLVDMYADTSDTAEAMHRLSVLRGFMHKMDLRYIQDEIRYRFDKKNTINLVWAAPKGERGISPDTLPQLLADEGIFINANTDADCFFAMLEMYDSAREEVNNTAEKVMLTTYGDAETIKNLRQKIARDILNAYTQKGKETKFARLVEKYTKQIADLKEKLRDANANNRLINEIVDRAQKLRDLKLGTFLNSTQYNTDIFKSSIEALGKIKYRGNFNIGGTRKIMADLRTWYTKDNPVLANSYEDGIANMLDSVANGKGGYTKEELRTINNLMAYFTNFVENFNKVYRQGRWVDALPMAEQYIETLRSNQQVKVGLFMKMAGSTYMQTFGDPMTVARRMDMYAEHGFFTETLNELRDATIEADISEMELRQDYDAFLERNKKYLQQAAKETIEYRGVAIPKMHLISLYMTLKRNHAQAGLAQNGFAFTDAEGKRVRVDGFAPEITEESELRAAAIDEQAAIASLLSDTDKEYIAILEKAFNVDAKRLKAERDMQRLGFTNATEDYYYPIRRGNIAKNVDASDIQGELDRVSSTSFNKDTVRGAKQELYIEAADAVFNRHIRAVAKYAALSPAIENYNKLYNLDIGGNPNKPISVATESANTWAKGNRYFSKLISDIQGIPASQSEGMKVLSYIRGSYAKFQLGANPKVWVTQLSSLFASSSILDADSIIRGVSVSSKGIDDYCPLAKLRANDNSAAMAQGIFDKRVNTSTMSGKISSALRETGAKVSKVSDVLMAPIGKMDRFVVCRLFGACQVQVEKNGGAKIGTEANKIEAGKLLKRVILETQQNSLATERSAAMRSGNEIMRTVTMFSADSMKVIGRVIDSIGELSTLNAKLRMTTDAESAAALRTQIKAAQKKVARSLGALATSAIFMAALAQLFKWLYNKDDDDEKSAAQQVLLDFAGNLLGGLPLFRDVYTRFVDGYEVSNYAYSALNDLLDSASNLFSAIEGLITGEESNTRFAARIKNLAYSLGQLSGIPTRNIYNVLYGLLKRVSPTTAYQIDEAFYAKNYVTDLNEAIEKDDTAMISMLMSLVMNERVGDVKMSAAVQNKFIELYKNGYSVLPRSIGDTISYGGVDIPLTDEEYSSFMATYAQSMKDIEKMVNNRAFKALSEELQAKAVKQVYDAYYYDALSALVGVDERTAVGVLSKWIGMEKLSVAFAGLSEITSDKDEEGETISGSKKKNTIDYLLKQNLLDGERLLILYYRGYTVQDGDYKGYTASRARRVLLQYIMGLRGTQEEKAAFAEKCGFTVRNGRIIRDF